MKYELLIASNAPCLISACGKSKILTSKLEIGKAAKSLPPCCQESADVTF